MLSTTSLKKQFSNLLSLLGAVAFASHAMGNTASEASRVKPNIIIIVADDQGYGDAGCYGSEEAETPNLDRMAKEGVRLTDFYVTHPSCTPSRAGLLTGRYAQRCKANWALIDCNHPAFNKEKIYNGGIPASEGFLLPALMKEAGYKTGCYGKWHLGYGQGQKPADRGFDDSLVSAMGHVDCFTGLFLGYPDIFKNGKVQDFSGYTNDASNSPLHGEKANLLEGGIRVPSIVKWPGVLPAGGVCKEPLLQLDFFNMALAAAGDNVPAERKLDGRNPTATLKGEAVSPHDRLVFQFHRSVAVREGRYKLYRPHSRAQSPLAQFELYDLENDIGETKNIAPEHPEIVQRLSAEPRLNELMELFKGTPRT